MGFDGGNCLAAENTPALCSNGIDDNCNGLTDCQDPECGGIQCAPGSVCSAKTCTPGCFIDGGFAAPGSSPASSPCQVCTPSLTLTAWVSLPQGQTATGCQGDFVCDGKGGCGLAQGVMCVADSDCSSDHCVDGVCCDSACNGTCQACAEVMTGQADGTCSPVTDGTDPQGDCAGAYACVHGGCAVTCEGCSDSINCTADGYCAGGQCLTKKSNGNAPGTCGATTCESGIVSNGICCNSACGDACESCLSMETGQPQGTCAPIPAGGTDPEGTCGNFACDGTGACATTCSGCSDTTSCVKGYYCSGGSCTPDTPDGTPVGACGATQCTSGHVYSYDNGNSSVCCHTDCTGTCQSCLFSDTGDTTGTCASVLAGSDPNLQCPGSYACNGSGACATSCSGCSGLAACKQGNYCDSPACTPLIATGQPDNATCEGVSCVTGDADGGVCVP